MKKSRIIAVFLALVAVVAVAVCAYNVGYNSAVHSVEAVEVTENGYNVTFDGEVYCYE